MHGCARRWGWAAIRGGPRGASLATLVIGAVAMWYAAAEAGPFTGEGHQHGMWQRQLFLALLATKSLIVGAMAAAQLKATSALRISELRFRRVFDHSAVGIGVVRADGRFSDANPALRNMLGFTTDELLQRTVADITHPDDREPGIGAAGRLLRGEENDWFAEKRYVRKDGDIIWATVSASIAGTKSGIRGRRQSSDPARLLRGREASPRCAPTPAPVWSNGTR